VPFVVAAGNESDDMQNHSPAAYNEVITVTNLADYDGKPGADGALSSTCDAGPDDDDDYRTNSNFATLTSDKAHTIAAPGTCILSTWHGGYIFNTISGTSMASPHVAGAVALIKSWAPGATPSQIKATLLATSNSEPWDDAIPTSTHSRWQYRSGFGYAKLHDERMMLANNF
jgi:subtilisin family serine protease